MIFEKYGAQGRRHARGVGLILDEDRDAVKRSDEAGGLERGIESIRFIEGCGIQRDDRVDSGTFLVIGLDAIEVYLHQLAAGELAGLIGRVDFVDGRFENTEAHDSASFE